MTFSESQSRKKTVLKLPLHCLSLSCFSEIKCSENSLQFRLPLIRDNTQDIFWLFMDHSFVSHSIRGIAIVQAQGSYICYTRLSKQFLDFKDQYLLRMSETSSSKRVNRGKALQRRIDLGPKATAYVYTAYEYWG